MRVDCSEENLQRELNRTRASGTYGRVRSGDVGSGTTASEASRRGIIETKTVLSTVWIGKVGMIENVEELSAELGAVALAKVPVLCHREIEVAETGIGENVASHGAEGSERRRNHDGASLRVTAEEVNGGGRGAGSSAIHR